MAKITVAEFRRRFPVGTPFTSKILLRNLVTKREVVKFSATDFVSKFLDGDKVGQEIYMKLKGLSISINNDLTVRHFEDRFDDEYVMTYEAGTAFAVFCKDT